MMGAATETKRATSPCLTLDIPIIPFPDLDGTGDIISNSVTRCTSPASPPETVVSTPASAFFPASSSPLAALSTSNASTAASTPLFSPVSAFSPPPTNSTGVGGSGTRRPERRETLGRRLKIRSGVNLQVHDLKLRQYTDYDTRTGTPRSPFFSPAIWTGNTFGERETPFAGPSDPNPFSSLIQSGNLSGLDEDSEDLGPFSSAGQIPGPPLSILDLYAIKTVTGAFNESGVITRMRHFAESRGRARDVDFLLKVEEYTNAVKAVETLLSDASFKLAGIAAPTTTSTASIKLPLRTTRTLSTETKDATTVLLPRLDGVFDDAKVVVEQSIAQDIYPDFLKSQLSLSLQAIGPGYSPNQVCPGFGEAFCMTDPHGSDCPVVYASDGLAGLTGYAVQDMINKNCRFMQGPGTRATTVERVREAMARNKEFSELVLNFKKDGRPFWNLIFVAPLLGLDGEVAYQLGGQIDVTEMLETQEDVACVLSYVPSLVDNPSSQQSLEDDSTEQQAPTSRLDQGTGSRHSSALSSRGRRLRGEASERADAAHSKYPPNTSKNKFLRNFLRRYSSASSYHSNIGSSSVGTNTISDSVTDIANSPSGLDPHSTLSTPTSNASYDARKSLNITPTPTGQPFAHHAVLSPYSRFIVMEYIPSPSSQGSGGVSGGTPSTETSNKKSSSRHLQLPVAFCSPAALESLGPGARSVADVVGASIFEVLSDKAHSPSVTKSFKSTVRASLAEGRNAKLDVTLNGNGGGRSRTATRGSSLSRRNNSGGLLCLPSSGGSAGGSDVAPSSSHGRSIRTSMSLERLVSRRNSADCGADYVSYWTPLRDDLGNTQYVVLILVPEVS